MALLHYSNGWICFLLHQPFNDFAIMVEAHEWDTTNASKTMEYVLIGDIIGKTIYSVNQSLLFCNAVCYMHCAHCNTSIHTYGVFFYAEKMCFVDFSILSPICMLPFVNSDSWQISGFSVQFRYFLVFFANRVFCIASQIPLCHYFSVGLFLWAFSLGFLPSVTLGTWTPFGYVHR